MFIDELSKLLSLLFPLCAILIFLDGAEEEVDLGDDYFCKGVRSCWAVRAGARASTECAMMGSVG